MEDTKKSCEHTRKTSKTKTPSPVPSSPMGSPSASTTVPSSPSAAPMSPLTSPPSVPPSPTTGTTTTAGIPISTNPSPRNNESPVPSTSSSSIPKESKTPPPSTSSASSSCSSSSSSSPARPTTSTVVVPGSSFLLSTLLNLKPTSSSSLTEEFNKKVNMKSKTIRNGDDESDSGLKITYEQISSKPPRKRLCYTYPSYKNNTSCTSSPNSNGIGFPGTTSGTNNINCSPIPPTTAKTCTSDEENIRHRKSPTSSSTFMEVSHQQEQSSVFSPRNLSPSSAATTANLSVGSQFPVVIRTDEFRRRGGIKAHTTTTTTTTNGRCSPSSSSSSAGGGGVERYLVASRDIEPGEVILKESPLIAGPISRKSKTLDKSKYCLGCYQHVNGLYKCSKCGWPVCNAKCEKMPDHAEFECEVFASNPVSPIVHSSEYEKIKVLRCLLLRDKYPERWNKLLELDAHDELRQGNFVAVSSTINLFKFIQQECHLRKFDGETVNHVVGVSAVNSFPTDGLVSPASTSSNKHQRGGVSNYVPVNASLIFFNASLLTQDCVPNSYPIISKPQNSFLVTVIASQRIKKGQIITHSYVDSTRGTFQRRSELKESYYFSCDCRRCADPSEFCTHYSSLKCPKANCQNGYLYPANPLSLDLGGLWICNYSPRCDFRITNSQVNELLKHVQYDISKTFVQHSLFQEYENLEGILEKYKGKVLHPNHFLIMDIQYAIVACINKLLVLVNEEEAIKLATKQIEYCRECLEIADILHPGSNRLRGSLLFYLHEGMLLLFLGEFKRNINQESFLKIGKNKFENIIKIMNESKAILINEPEGSAEYQKIKTLTLDSANLQPLLKYFDVKL